GEIEMPEEVIQRVAHISFVQGADNVDFLKRRYEAMRPFDMFEGMEYSENPDVLAEWMPLMMKGRNPGTPVAASRIDYGTDVNFGELTRKLAKNISEHDNAEVHYKHEVLDFKQLEDSSWEVKILNIRDGKIEYHTADYIFIGAGGNAIPLLQKTGI